MKYERIINIALLAAVIVCSILLYLQRQKLKDAQEFSAAMQINNAALIQEYQRLEKNNKIILDSLGAEIVKGDKTIVIEQKKYDTIKKTPIRRNISDIELDAWLKSFQSSKRSARRNP